MSDERKSGSSGSRRRRRRRGRRNRKKNNNNSGGKKSGSSRGSKGSRGKRGKKSRGSRGSRGSKNRRGRGNSRNRRGGNRKSTPREKFGGRDPKDVSAGKWNGPSELNAFELFCSYHLGIFENNSYRDPSLKSVAKLFGRSIDEVRDALSECGLDDNTVRESSYDLSLARLDVKVAPNGIDKRELAKNLYDEFIAEHPSFVDWSESSSDDEDVEQTA